MKLYTVHVIIPGARTLATTVLAADEATARRLAVTNCPQAKGTLAYGEVVGTAAPTVGATLVPAAGPVVARRRPRPAARRPRSAKRIPAPIGAAFEVDAMSRTDEDNEGFGDACEVRGWLADLLAKAATVAAELADAEAIREGFDDESNFLAPVASAYDVDAEGWDGWSVHAGR